MWRKLIARYLLLARAILPLLRHTRGAARGRRKSPRRLLGLGSAAFSPFYCDKNPDGERPAFWKTGFRGGWLEGKCPITQPSEPLPGPLPLDGLGELEQGHLELRPRHLRVHVHHR